MKKFLVIFVLGIVMASLVACGGGGSGGGGNTLNITMTDFAFTPSAWSVTAGSSVTVDLKNNGTVPHTWTLMSKPVTGSYTDADKANVIFDSGAVAGASKTVTFTAPTTAGSYQVICTQPGHFEAGMIGSLTVK